MNGRSCEGLDLIADSSGFSLLIYSISLSHSILWHLIFPNQVKIELNITFWALDCTLVHLCAMDVAGENHLFIDDDMSKQRLNSKRNALGKPVKVSANSKPSSSLTHRTEEDYCGPCYKVEK